MWNCFTGSDKYNNTATTLLRDMFVDNKSGLKDSLIVTEASYQRVEELLKVGANPNIKFKNPGEKETPLISFASLTGNSRLVSLLVEHGANPNTVDKNGYSCLSLALKSSELKVSKDLVNGNNFADMVVDYAKRNLFDRYNTVKVLLDAGADVNKLLKDKTSPVHQLVIGETIGTIMEEKPINVAEKVSKDLSKIEVVSTGLTAIKGIYEKVYEKSFEHEERFKVLDLLASKNFNLNLVEKNGYTPLHYAVSKRDIKTVDKLLSLAVNVNATSHKGYSPLHIAALNADKDMVEKLIKNQANVNVRSKSGYTPFHIAAYKGQGATVKLLAENNAIVETKDKKGRDAIDFALMNNFMEVALYIKGVSKEKNAHIENQKSTSVEKMKSASVKRPAFYNVLEDINKATQLKPALEKAAM